jgi:hypothetical protein
MRFDGCSIVACATLRRELAYLRESVLWISPGWIENWRRIWQEYLGWSAMRRRAGPPPRGRGAVGACARVLVD